MSTQAPLPLRLRRIASRIKELLALKLAGRSLAFHRNLAYGTGGGRQLRLDLLVPKAPLARPAPAVVWIHGGGWEQGHKERIPAVRMLSGAGFATASIEYRLSGEARFPAQIEDAKCAVRFLRVQAGRYGIDPDRIGVAGSSAGGHLAALVATAGPDANLEGNGGWPGVSSRVQAAASWYGISDFTSGALEHHPRLGRVVIKLFGGSERDHPELYRQASPLCHITPDAPPLFLAHGEEDELVPFDQSERLAEAYRAAGLDVELIAVKNAGHDFTQAGSAANQPPIREIRRRTVEFFRRTLAATRADAANL
jgi:acetyl esterase/lipase